MGKFIDITGQKFNDWTAIEYIGSGKWKFECSCGSTHILEGRSVRSGRTKSCGHGYNNFIDITQKISGDFEAIEYIGNKTWRCKCTICGKEKNIRRKSFTEEKTQCNHRNIDRSIQIHKVRCSDKVGKVFGDFKVMHYIDGGHWDCKCNICGKTKVISTYALTKNKNRCNHLVKGDIINDWRILDIVSNTVALCECSCGEVRQVNINSILRGKSKSCGHNSNKKVDMTGKIVGNWRVIEYIGNGYYRCQCQCEAKTISDVHTYSLRNGGSNSCGCKKRELSLESKLNKYGEINLYKTIKPRERWQIDTINSRELLLNYIGGQNKDITVTELADNLGINYSTMLQRLKKYNLQDNVNIKYNISSKERELNNVVQEMYNGEVITNKIGIITNKELDIYIPEKRLAIEFNGSYWHSDIFKNRLYHQQKTINCAKQGIRLIHIFEYEWDNPDIRENLIGILNRVLIKDSSRRVVYARKTEIKIIEAIETNEFCNKYHLQGSTDATVNLGCYYQNELIGVLTFGKPRFNSNYEYEIHRLCWKPNIQVVGGAEKLFSHFLKTFNPQSIITYVDISKFTGNVYSRLGFKPIQPNPITEPNYVWVQPNKGLILSRYKTQKHKLIELGIGTEEQTEDDIMNELGFLKIYDSGNLKLEWLANK